MSALRVLSVFGTRPEAIKMMPVLRALKARGDVEAALCVTAQHRQLLDQILVPFAIKPDFDLDVMRPDQSLNGLMQAILEGLDPVLQSFKPDWVVVQGDTASALTGAIAAFNRKIKVAHVEAGLRSGNLAHPWPEEMNRRCIDQFADLMFAPTEGSRRNLLVENIPAEKIVVTGNTAIDALHHAIAELKSNAALRAQSETQLSRLDPARRLILVTGHRRESFGNGLLQICAALKWLAGRGDVEIVYPLHPNPNVTAAVRERLGGEAAIHLIEPSDYLPFVALMQRANIIISDSGGIQEEAPTLHRPVLVTRETTERPEGVEAGVTKLVGTDADKIVAEATALLDDPAHYKTMTSGENPYGDGHAAERIVEALVRA